MDDNEWEEWYGKNEYDYETTKYGEERSYQTRPRRRRRESSTAPPWSSPQRLLDTFLGGRREELEEQYREQMGLPDPYKREERRQRRPRSQIYFEDEYEEDEYSDDDGDEKQDEIDPWRDVRDSTVQADRDNSDDNDVDPLIVDAEVESTTNSTIHEGRAVQKLTWEERALAMERVPPATVRAWGPQGALGIDARTKAVQDALEDIELSKQAVKKRHDKVEQLKDDIAVLRVDAELQKSQIKRRTDMTRMQVKERLRHLDFSVDELARSLRYQESLLKMAKEDLAELEARHWAVLTHCDPEDYLDGFDGEEVISEGATSSEIENQSDLDG